MQDLVKALRGIMELPDDDIPVFRQFVRARKFAKGETIFRVGEVCDNLFFILDGLVRCYYIYDNKEINLRLLCEPSAALAYSSYITGQPARESLAAMSDCYGYMVRLRDLLKALEPLSAEQLQRDLAERHYLSMERRLLTLQRKTASERYAYFQKHMEPRIVQDTPEYHVASYLGLAPESLSRIKANA